MSMASQAVLNQNLYDDQEFSSQLGIFSFPSNTFTSNIPYGCNIQPAQLRSFTTPTLSESGYVKQKEDFLSHFGGPQILPLQRSSSNLWAWGDVSGNMISKKNGMENHLGISAIKMKKVKGRRKVREPRFCFKTLSDVDVLDDGYKWRKYGQKVVKNTQHPRSYYRCTQDNCRVKKRIERFAEDPRMVITTYEGRHIHTPSNDDDDSRPSSHMNSIFW